MDLWGKGNILLSVAAYTYTLQACIQEYNMDCIFLGVIDFKCQVQGSQI